MIVSRLTLKRKNIKLYKQLKYYTKKMNYHSYIKKKYKGCWKENKG